MTAANRAPIGRTAAWRRGYPGRVAGLLPVLLSRLLFLFRSLVGARRLLVPALAVGLLLAPLPAALGHEQPEMALQSDVSSLDWSEHGHSHDDEPGDNAAGSSHSGHDPADHSHQPAFLSASLGNGLRGLPQRWTSLGDRSPEQAAGLGIDRPPKRMMSL